MLWRLFLLLVVFFASSSALVDDRAKLLRSSTIAHLEVKIDHIHRATGYDIVLMTRPLSDVNAANAHDVARRFAGDQLRGIIFLFSPKGLWIFTSESLATIFTATVKRRIWTGMVQQFKRGDFDGGAMYGVEEAENELQYRPVPKPEPLVPAPQQRPPEKGMGWMTIIFIIFLSLMALCCLHRCIFGNSDTTPVYSPPIRDSHPSHSCGASYGSPPPYNPSYSSGVGGGPQVLSGGVGSGGGNGGGGSGGGWVSSIVGGAGGAFLGNAAYDAAKSIFQRPEEGNYTAGQVLPSQDLAYRPADRMDYGTGYGGNFQDDDDDGNGGGGGGDGGFVRESSFNGGTFGDDESDAEA